MQSRRTEHTFVGVLIKAAKCIDLAVTTVCNGGIDQASGPLSACPGDLGFVAIL